MKGFRFKRFCFITLGIWWYGDWFFSKKIKYRDYQLKNKQLDFFKNTLLKEYDEVTKLQTALLNEIQNSVLHNQKPKQKEK